MTKKQSEWNSCVNDLQKLKLTPKEQKLREENMKKYTPSKVLKSSATHLPKVNARADGDNVDFRLVRELLQGALEKRDEQYRTDKAFEREVEDFTKHRQTPVIVRKSKTVAAEPIFPQEEGIQMTDKLHELDESLSDVEVKDVRSLLDALCQFFEVYRRRSIDDELERKQLRLKLEEISREQMILKTALSDMQVRQNTFEEGNTELSSTLLQVAGHVDKLQLETNQVKSKIADLDCQLYAESISRNVKSLLFSSAKSQDEI